MSKHTDQLERVLKSHGLFLTKPRKQIFSLLQNNSATSLNQLIKLSQPTNQATVYRTLNSFEKLGIVKKIWLGNFTKYELGDEFQHHHHHLSCTKCGESYALPENSEIEKLIAQVGSSNGFKPTDHQLDIIGICVSCQKGRRA